MHFINILWKATIQLQFIFQERIICSFVGELAGFAGRALEIEERQLNVNRVDAHDTEIEHWEK